MKIFIAMSGGVDSAVAAMLTSRGNDAIGGTMRLHDRTDAELYPENACATDQDIRDAASICARLGIPHTVCDLEDEFHACVVSDFISSYSSGKTPNPCVVCNRRIKFGELLRIALAEGCDKLATGHYARIERREDGRYILKKALDLSKDQSYVLYSLTQEQLAHVIFPLGELTKSQVREIAEREGFTNARKHDSQDICFIPDGDYAAFIEHVSGKTPESGNFVDTSGNILGTHRGIIHYTVGQRKGLGISLGEPMYVLSKDALTNTVVLARNEELFSTEIIAGDVNLISVDRLDSPMRVRARIRYNQTEQPATVHPLPDGKIKVVFDEPQRAPTAGQSVVLYDGDVVVGGGIIEN